MPIYVLFGRTATGSAHSVPIHADSQVEIIRLKEQGYRFAFRTIQRKIELIILRDQEVVGMGVGDSADHAFLSARTELMAGVAPYVLKDDPAFPYHFEKIAGSQSY